MGLDQYMFEIDDGHREELHYWRKHNRLQGYMENLYREKREAYNNLPLGDRFINALDGEEPYQEETFNCVDLFLDEDDLDRLEEIVSGKELPKTQGFFFGTDSYDYEEYTIEDDLKAIEKARKSLKEGKQVVYSCWW